MLRLDAMRQTEDTLAVGTRCGGDVSLAAVRMGAFRIGARAFGTAGADMFVHCDIWVAAGGGHGLLTEGAYGDYA